MVEIIPKPVQRPPSWQNILLSFSVGLLLISIISYFALGYFIQKSETAFQDLEQALAQKETEEEIALEQEVFGYQKKIGDFSGLVNQHIYPSQVFTLFESLCHPQAWFSKMNVDFGTQRISVFGKTNNFLILDQQLSIFEQEELVKEVGLSNVSIGKEGLVNFTLNFVLDPVIVKK